MKYIFLIILFLFSNVYADENLEALKELHNISKVSFLDLNELLSNCENNQQSMYFCAWRDYLIEKNRLHNVVNKKKTMLPYCAQNLQTHVNKWEAPLYADCKKYSLKDDDKGSLQPTAQMLCMSASTKNYTKTIEKISRCEEVKKL